jgi:hypothetical protein
MKTILIILISVLPVKKDTLNFKIDTVKLIITNKQGTQKLGTIKKVKGSYKLMWSTLY